MRAEVEPGRAFGPRHALACGVLWGCAVTLIDTLVQPTGDLPAPALIRFMLAIGWTWCADGVLWALAAMRFTRLSTPRAAAAVLAVGVATTVAHSALKQLGPWLPFAGGVEELLQGPFPASELFVHVLWINLFYGGLYVAGYIASARALQSSRLLAQVARVRAEADASVAEAQLRARRGQIQPATLIEALAVLRARYTTEPARAAALFDRLVSFLRAAMPGVRLSRTTLEVELGVITDYLALRCAIDGRHGAWRVDIDEPPSDLPFPSLLLMPTIEAMSRCATPAAPARLAARPSNGGYEIRLTAPGCASIATLPAELEQRLRIGLRAEFGDRATLTLGGDRDRGLDLRIVLPLTRAAASTDMFSGRRFA